MISSEKMGPMGDAVTAGGQLISDAAKSPAADDCSGHSTVGQPPVGSTQYDELHKKTAEVLPMCFEGAKVSVSKGLSQNFQISHTLMLSEMASGYKFGATYVGTKKVGGEAFPLLTGDMDLSGNSNAILIHQFPKNLRLRLQSNIQQSQLVNGSVALDRIGRLSTIGLRLVNPNLLSNSFGFSANYLRRVTERLDIGAEYVYQRDTKIPGGQVSALSYALRYTTPHWTLAGTVANRGLHVSYHHKQTPTLQFAVDFESSFQAQESVTTFAYQCEIPDAVTVRASIDTNWTVGAVLEKRLSRTLPFTFVLSGMYSHPKSALKMGVGLVIG